MVNIPDQIRTAWRASAPLTATTILMLAAFLASCAGILLDERMITGAPAWLKPAKFAISSAIFCGTMAWLFRYVTIWPRFMRALGWTLSLILVLEVAIIDVQAARGTTSHFNVDTPLDGALFGIMGVSIAILWLASVGVLVALLRQKFADPAWGWWLRMGMLVTVIGSAAGGLMLRVTAGQGEMLRASHSLSPAGAHTVGGPDGGPGLPGVGWSTRHGDLRIPHFFGLHGAQIIPFLGWLALRGRRAHPVRRQVAFAAALTASYLAFIAILAWQAFRGQSVVAPDNTTLIAIAVWMAATVAAVVFFRAPAVHGSASIAASQHS